MNINKSSLFVKLQPIISLSRRHAVLLGIMAFAVVYGYIIVRVSSLANTTPSETEVTQKVEAVPHPKIDKETASKIENLEDQNINVQAIFKEARENPFSE